MRKGIKNIGKMVVLNPERLNVIIEKMKFNKDPLERKTKEDKLN